MQNSDEMISSMSDDVLAQLQQTIAAEQKSRAAKQERHIRCFADGVGPTPDGRWVLEQSGRFYYVGGNLMSSIYKLANSGPRAIIKVQPALNISDDLVIDSRISIPLDLGGLMRPKRANQTHDSVKLDRLEAVQQWVGPEWAVDTAGMPNCYTVVPAHTVKKD